MNSRLQQFLAAENISQAQFADSLNVARASISHILAGRNKPSYDFISSLMVTYPELNLEWLMFGKGKMYKDQIEPRQNLLLFDEEISEENPEQSKEIPEKIQAINKTVISSNTSETIKKQRNISKVIVLFDDGSFQEI